MENTSVESVFLEALIEDTMDEAYEASIYGDYIDHVAELTSLGEVVHDYLESADIDHFKPAVCIDNMVSSDNQRLEEIAKEEIDEDSQYYMDDVDLPYNAYNDEEVYYNGNGCNLI